MDGRCGDCKFAKETDSAELIECHGDYPRAVTLITQQGPQFVTVFPRMPYDSFCHWHEAGEPVRYSRIIKAGAAAMPVVTP